MNYEELVKAIYPKAELISFSHLEKPWWTICAFDSNDEGYTLYLGDTTNLEDVWQLAWEDIQEMMVEKLK